eukprot:6213434-Pleurochrysis_carterae.AAC.2
MSCTSSHSTASSTTASSRRARRTRAHPLSAPSLSLTLLSLSLTLDVHVLVLGAFSSVLSPVAANVCSLPTLTLGVISPSRLFSVHLNLFVSPCAPSLLRSPSFNRLTSLSSNWIRERLLTPMPMPTSAHSSKDPPRMYILA